jgi:hypothetical protein
MHRPLRTLQLLASTATLALAGYITLRHRKILAEQEKPFGHYTRQQMLERTLPLCRTLRPDADRFALSAEHNLTQGLHGRLWRLWTVEYTDPTGEHVAEFTWDADTGELERVGHRTTQVSARQSTFASHTRPRTEEQTKARAARLAYRWLHRLGFTQERSRWRLTKSPEQTPGCDVWSTLWRSGERVVFVNVNVVSGDLVYATRCHPSALPPVP